MEAPSVVTEFLNDNNQPTSTLTTSAVLNRLPTISIAEKAKEVDDSERENTKKNCAELQKQAEEDSAQNNATQAVRTVSDFDQTEEEEETPGKEQEEQENDSFLALNHWTPIFGSFTVDSQQKIKVTSRLIVEELTKVFEELTNLLSRCSVSISKLRCIFDDSLSPTRVYFSMELLQELKSYLTSLSNSLPLIKGKITDAEQNYDTALLLGGVRSLLLISLECISETSYFFDTLTEKLNSMIGDPKLQALDPSSGLYYLQASRVYSVYFDHMKIFKPTMKHLNALSQIYNFFFSLTTKTVNPKHYPLRFPFYSIDEFLSGCGLMRTDAYVPVPVDFGNISLGFEYDRNLKNYSRSLKTVYCAMAAYNKAYGCSSVSPWSPTFSLAFVNYFMSQTRRDEDLEEIKVQVTVDFLKHTWSLVEDPAVHMMLRSYNQFWSKDSAVDSDLVISIPNSDKTLKAKLISYQPRNVSPSLFRSSQESLAKAQIARSNSDGSFFSNMFTYFSRSSSKEFEPIPESRSDEQLESLSEQSTASSNQSNLDAAPLKNVEVAIPPEAVPGTIILHIHGGGFISQSPKSHSFYLKDWVNQNGIPIISLDYSKSPDHVYPTALEEAYALYKWLLQNENLKLIGIECPDHVPHKIVLVGDSAGANLCCALTIKAIEDKITLPTGCLLHYPVVNVSESVSVSRLMFANDPVLSCQTLKVCLDSYLSQQYKIVAMTDHLISCGFATDEVLKEFPPCIICVGDIDPLLDDSTFFAYRLLQAERNVKLKIYRGLPHGYLNLGFVIPAAIPAIKESGDFISQLMANDDAVIGSFEVLSYGKDEEEEETESEFSKEEGEEGELLPTPTITPTTAVAQPESESDQQETSS
eukprot:TRINITY_DN3144_c0_g1_i1.p1 TRINITY_DN3144_c0_g1~~TRINITY_DN3144_c0_g1_i1.p1  ORF type:complete len:867 (+),score=204.33 TRINITY_DN3144_c0_g1_i1:174-2774(+)